MGLDNAHTRKRVRYTSEEIVLMTRGIDDAFELRGRWFLPQNCKLIGTGMVYYNKGEILLSISCPTANMRSVQLLLGMPREIISEIHGIMDTGEKITLLKCYFTQDQVSNGFHTIKYTALQMFISGLFEPVQDDVFHSLEAAYSNFNLWHARIASQLSPTDPDTASPQEESLDIDLPSDSTLRIYFKNNLPSIVENVILGKRTIAMINSDKPRSLEKLLEAHNCFRYFLMLAMMGPVHPKQYSGHTNNQVIEIYPNIRIYSIRQKNSRNRMLFTFSDISNNFTKIIFRWWQLYEEYNSAIINYFSAILNEHLATVELTFQTVVQALESYATKKFPDPCIPSSEYNQMIESLKSDATDEQKHFIERFRDLGNRPSLKIQLERLVKICPQVFESEENRKSFSKTVTAMRGRLAHGNQLTDPSSQMELFFLIQQMKILMDSLLLYELPINLEQRETMITKDRQHRNFARTYHKDDL